MQDAAIERLAKIISDKYPDDGSSHQRKPIFQLHIGLAEGWFTLFLLITIVYSTIWCVQAADWVDHLNILTLTTALGLIVGLIAAKQRRLPRLPSHLIAIGFGLLLAFWQTAGADYAGNTLALARGMHQWYLIALAGGTSNDDSIVFLFASLLLLLRFNLHESVQRWRRQGLRYGDDLGWDVMQAGILISIGVLLFSWILPWGYVNDTASQLWNANANPYIQLENIWNRLVPVSGGFTQIG